MPKDPVCGSEVEKSSVKSVYKGKTFYFCCASCQFAFEKGPKKFVK